jgi:hypothetical protein
MSLEKGHRSLDDGKQKKINAGKKEKGKKEKRKMFNDAVSSQTTYIYIYMYVE